MKQTLVVYSMYTIKFPTGSIFNASASISFSQDIVWYEYLYQVRSTCYRLLPVLVLVRSYSTGSASTSTSTCTRVVIRKRENMTVRCKTGVNVEGDKNLVQYTEYDQYYDVDNIFNIVVLTAKRQVYQFTLTMMFR
jgi:hypothetical protein